VPGSCTTARAMVVLAPNSAGADDPCSSDGRGFHGRPALQDRHERDHARMRKIDVLDLLPDGAASPRVRARACANAAPAAKSPCGGQLSPEPVEASVLELPGKRGRAVRHPGRFCQNGGALNGHARRSPFRRVCVQLVRLTSPWRKVSIGAAGAPARRTALLSALRKGSISGVGRAGEGDQAIGADPGARTG